MLTQSESLDGWIVSCTFVNNDQTFCVCLAGNNGSVCLLKWGEEKKKMMVVTKVCVETSMAWCGMLSSGMIVTASATKLIHVWKLSSDGRLLILTALFPGKARFGSPDGIGGTGDVDGNDIAIGDEAGTLYLLNCCEK